MKKTLITLSALFLSSISFAEIIQCKVTEVLDRNTITCLTIENKQVEVKLWGIDAPESGQDFGQESKQALSDMIYGKDINIETKDRDRHKKTFGVVLHGFPTCSNYDFPECRNWTLNNINLRMIKQGYAWYYPFDGENSEYQQAEQEAREAKRGLWVDPNPVPPWEWRKQKGIR